MSTPTHPQQQGDRSLRELCRDAGRVRAAAAAARARARELRMRSELLRKTVADLQRGPARRSA